MVVVVVCNWRHKTFTSGSRHMRETVAKSWYNLHVGEDVCVIGGWVESGWRLRGCWISAEWIRCISSANAELGKLALSSEIRNRAHFKLI